MQMLICTRTSCETMTALKVVQTDVDPKLHGRLRQLAARRRVSLKAVIRDALAAYVSREVADWEDDPILGMIGSVRLGASGWSRRKDWRP